jgi:dTMP kinase
MAAGGRPGLLTAYTRAVSGSNPGARRGVFITLEGPDGSGKSSLAPRLADALRARGCDVVATREPGSTRLGERIRDLLLSTEPGLGHTGAADAFLFAAARAQHVTEVIKPALARGAVVVCDRFADSSMAYQGHGSGVPVAELAVVQRLATGGLVPDLTILLDLPVEAGLRRKAGDAAGGVTRFESGFDLAYHQRVRDAFLAFAAAEPARYRIVDATLPVDAVLEAAMTAILTAGLADPCLDGAPGTSRGVR